MEIPEVLARVGQQQHCAAGDPLSDHLDTNNILMTQKPLRYFAHQSVYVWTLPDQVEVAGVWPLME